MVCETAVGTKPSISQWSRQSRQHSVSHDNKIKRDYLIERLTIWQDTLGSQRNSLCKCTRSILCVSSLMSVNRTLRGKRPGCVGVIHAYWRYTGMFLWRNDAVWQLPRGGTRKPEVIPRRVSCSLALVLLKKKKRYSVWFYVHTFVVREFQHKTTLLTTWLFQRQSWPPCCFGRCRMQCWWKRPPVRVAVADGGTLAV